MAITVANYQSFIRNRLDDPSYDAVKLLQFLNDANREICNHQRWRFMESVFIGNITIGVSSYALPTNFQAAINFTLTDPDANARFVSYMPYELYDQKYPDPTALTTATPTLWTFYGNSLIVGPALPDQAYTMQLRYIKSPATLTDASNTLDVPDDFSEIVVLSAYRRALMTNDSFDQAQIVQQEIDEKMEAMSDRLQSRQFGEPVRFGVGR
jgi:hypothetical protein